MLSPSSLYIQQPLHNVHSVHMLLPQRHWLIFTLSSPIRNSTNIWSFYWQLFYAPLQTYIFPFCVYVPLSSPLFPFISHSVPFSPHLLYISDKVVFRGGATCSSTDFSQKEQNVIKDIYHRKQCALTLTPYPNFVILGLRTLQMLQACYKNNKSSFES